MTPLGHGSHWRESASNGALRFGAEAVLGQLVQFPKVQVDRARPGPEGGGQLLIFTGVRYERRIDPLPPGPPTVARGNTKRG